MNEKATFKNRVAEPLEAVVGKALLAVNYWILDFEKADFLEEQPNASGISVVSLHFGVSNIELAPGWEKPLRANGIHHHIQAFHADGPGSVESVSAKHLCKVAAVQVAPWNEVAGKLLTRVEVVGLGGSPQAVCFSFSKTALVVATGYSGSSLEVGDGDELLVFSGQDWHHQIRNHKQLWERLWMSSSATHDELLVK